MHWHPGAGGGVSTHRARNSPHSGTAGCQWGCSRNPGWELASQCGRETGSEQSEFPPQWVGHFRGFPRLT